MRYIIIFIILVFGACKTAEQRALSHIEKAIKLWPGVIQAYKKDTTLIIIHKDTILFPGDTLQASFYCDSIMRQLAHIGDSLKRIGSKEQPKIIIVENKGGKRISVGSNGGRLNIISTTPPDTIYRIDTFPYKVMVPGIAIKVPVNKVFWKDTWFWLFLLLLVIMAFFTVWMIKK